MNTELTCIRKPTQAEKTKGAEVVFIREGKDGKTHTIYGAKCYESWEQWGETQDILADNISDIEFWRRHGFGRSK